MQTIAERGPHPALYDEDPGILAQPPDTGPSVQQPYLGQRWKGVPIELEVESVGKLADDSSQHSRDPGSFSTYFKTHPNFMDGEAPDMSEASISSPRLRQRMRKEDEAGGEDGEEVETAGERQGDTDDEGIQDESNRGSDFQEMSFVQTGHITGKRRGEVARHNVQADLSEVQSASSALDVLYGKEQPPRGKWDFLGSQDSPGSSMASLPGSLPLSDPEDPLNEVLQHAATRLEPSIHETPKSEDILHPLDFLETASPKVVHKRKKRHSHRRRTQLHGKGRSRAVFRQASDQNEMKADDPILHMPAFFEERTALEKPVFTDDFEGKINRVIASPPDLESVEAVAKKFGDLETSGRRHKEQRAASLAELVSQNPETAFSALDLPPAALTNEQTGDDGSKSGKNLSRLKARFRKGRSVRKSSGKYGRRKSRHHHHTRLQRYVFIV